MTLEQLKGENMPTKRVRKAAKAKPYVGWAKVGFDGQIGWRVCQLRWEAETCCGRSEKVSKVATVLYADAVRAGLIPGKKVLHRKHKRYRVYLSGHNLHPAKGK